VLSAAPEVTVRKHASVGSHVEVPLDGRGSPGNCRGRAHAYKVCLWPPVNRGRYEEGLNIDRFFPAYHPLMERTLESTLLHLTRSRMVEDYPTQIGQCLAVITDEDLWWRPTRRATRSATSCCT
jgi:hypothetical protein